MSLPCSGMMSSWVTQKKSPHRVYSGRTLGQPRGNPIFSGRVASCNNQHTAEHQAPHHQWVGWEGSLPRAWIPARQQQRRSHLRSTGLKRNTRNLCLMHKKIRGLPWQFSGWDSILPECIGSNLGWWTKIPHAGRWPENLKKKKKTPILIQ